MLFQSLLKIKNQFRLGLAIFLAAFLVAGLGVRVLAEELVAPLPETEAQGELVQPLAPLAPSGPGAPKPEKSKPASDSNSANPASDPSAPTDPNASDPSAPVAPSGPGATNPDSPTAPSAPGVEADAAAEAIATAGPTPPINAQITGTNDGNNLITGTQADLGPSDGSKAGVNSGNALAVANVISLVNTNIFNSNGFILLLNDLFGVSGNLDLRNLDALFANPDYGVASRKCSLLECSSGGGLEIKNQNTANITNDVVVRSGTGENAVSNATGDGAINTGSAYAAANVVNIANTNIVDANYGILVFNAFGGWGGDVILPSLSGASGSGDSSVIGSASTEIVNINKANIGNNVDNQAGTGDNTIQNIGGDGAINSGAAEASTNVLNQVNQNIFNRDSILIVFRIFGNWTGKIQSQSDGLLWEETPTGLMVYSPQPESAAVTNIGGGGGPEETEIRNYNTANIQNNVSVLALTGENNITNAAGNATVNTGDAFSAANIVNVANTNVVGKNWLIALINIFGDWGGSATYGKPNLWVGGRADLGGRNLGPGTELTYRFTIVNNGDADARDVQLTSTFDKGLLEFQGPGGVAAAANAPKNERTWNIGLVPAGETVEAVFKARVSDRLPYGETVINTRATVASAESDFDATDNSDVVVLAVYNDPYFGTPTGGPVRESPNPARTAPPDFLITKQTSATAPVAPGDKIDFEITLRNYGQASGYDTVLVDRIIGPNGKVVNEQKWPLDEVFREEEIVVTYTVELSKKAYGGVYVNDAYVTALAGSAKEEFGYPIISDSASVQFQVTGDPAPVAPPAMPATVASTTPVAVASANVTPKKTSFSGLVKPSKPKMIAPDPITDNSAAQFALANQVIPLGEGATTPFLIAIALTLLMWWRSELLKYQLVSRAGDGGRGPDDALIDPMTATIELREIGREIQRVIEQIGDLLLNGADRLAQSVLTSVSPLQKTIRQGPGLIRKLWTVAIVNFSYYFVRFLTGHKIDRNLIRHNRLVSNQIGDGGGGLTPVQAMPRPTFSKIITRIASRQIVLGQRIRRIIIDRSQAVHVQLIRSRAALQAFMKHTAKTAKKMWVKSVTRLGCMLVRRLTGQEVAVRKPDNLPPDQ